MKITTSSFFLLKDILLDIGQRSPQLPLSHCLHPVDSRNLHNVVNPPVAYTSLSGTRSQLVNSVTYSSICSTYKQCVPPIFGYVGCYVSFTNIVIYVSNSQRNSKHSPSLLFYVILSLFMWPIVSDHVFL